MKDAIVDIPDFPKKGILFKDISPVLASAERFQEAISRMTEDVDMTQVDLVAGIESRGFIFAAAIAAKEDKGFLPIRKIGKLPPPVVSHPYTLEYGEGVLEVKEGRGRVLLVDDVLATGGTLKASIALCEKAGYKIVDVAVLIDLRALNNFKWEKQSAKSVVFYE